MKRLGWLLGALAFVALLAWGSRRAAASSADDKIVLRLVHTYLTADVIAGFAAAVEEYERLHPDVRIEQQAIPYRMYAAWLRTRFIGGTAPQIIELPGDSLPEDLTTYVRELTPDVLRPNPYNAGTELADVLWRDTFVTGLREPPNYVEVLLGYYSVPASVITYRILYNRELLRQLTGMEAPPLAADDFAALCAQIQRAAGERGLEVVPIAADGKNGRFLLMHLMRTATPLTLMKLDPYGHYWNWDDELAVARVLGRWSMRTPTVLASLADVAAVGRQLPPGFLQLGPGEGTFAFMQGKAVFLIAQSFEYTLYREQCPFPLGIAPMPMASAPTARANAEGNIQPVCSLAIARDAPHAEQALDFLQFLSSRSGNAELVRQSRWLPAIRGVQPIPELEPYSADLAGDPPGFSLWLYGEREYIPVNRHLHELVGPGGSVESFIRRAEPDIDEGWRQVLARNAARTRRNIGRFDLVFGAMERLEAAGDPVDPGAPRNPAGVLEMQLMFQARAGYYELALAAAEAEEPLFAELPDRPPPVPDPPDLP